MEKLNFLNYKNKETYYLKWECKNPKCNLIISHGMAEHPYRYDEFAKYLNSNGINVYCLFQIGHGDVYTVKGHMEKGEFFECVTNINDLVDLINKENNLPIFLLGHSMGSFIAQRYIQLYNNISGVILSGSNKINGLMKFGRIPAFLVKFFAIKKDKPSYLMNNLSFGAYNKAFKNPRTKFDWLSNDDTIVDKYIDDPYCGYVCTKSFFVEMLSVLKDIDKKKNYDSISKDLPILIQSGALDPVGENGNGPVKLKELYDNYQIKDVTLLLYENDRHEIYNELNKKDVYKVTLDFINSHIK